MPPSWRNSAAPYTAVLAACIAAAYLNAVSGPFQYDDYNVIVFNAAVHSWPALWDTMPGIRALLKVSYVANWVSDWGASGFHAVNIGIHAFNGCIVYTLSRRWLRQFVHGTDHAQFGAMFAALIFALHPAQTEAVTYISGRSSSLMATCYLGAVWLSEPDIRARALGWSTFSVLVLFAMAIAVKEIAWILPLALVLRDRAVYRAKWRDTLRAHALLFVALVVAMVAFVAIPGYWRLLSASLETRSLGANLLTQIDGVWYLITQPLLLQLNLDPDLSVQTHWNPSLVLKASALVALIVFGVAMRTRHRAAAFAIAWFFLHLAPTNSILPRYDIANDRQLYLALLAPALLLSAWCIRIDARNLRFVAAGVLCVVLAITTVLRNQDYATEVALWEATAKRSPNKARVWNNLGYVRQKARDLAGAKLAYDRALTIDPEHINARINRYTLE